ncbi:amino acid transporter-like protein [Trichoderma citrinoviride]|uniref:Amino acid transporter-like protein n=1 Tax=Trichoderma citrinoviride TaxID=58853 RepID=A0A2T4BBD9_9HYPO|nr:amino acid transporter-like protein [Trichoderma citrinoviride]PTB66652.1 amino acid transporter-like protein [Trichoderma citrinoviride]
MTLFGTKAAASGDGALQPRLSTLSTMAMAFAILNTWIALAGSIGLVLPSGSSVALLYGFIFCVLCCFCVAASLGELSSIWPTAGGQYHFVYALCTERWRKPVVDNLAQFISAAAVVASNGAYQITAARTYGIFVAVLVFTTVANIWGNKILGKWNDAALYWSLFGVVIISIVLLSMSDKTSAEFVFTDFNNETGWSDGMAWILGLLQSALSLIAFDVVLHMTEEMPNPARDAPRAMLYSIVIGGVTGFAFILVMLFCLVDADTVLATPTGMPIVELILQATKSRAAATILSLMLSVCFINGTNASITSVSRLLYAMARDRGIVFHNYFAHIQSGLNVPVRTIMFCFVFNILFGLLYLGPVVAFSAYVASCTIFLNVSYAIPIIILLIRGRKVLDHYQTAKTPFKLGRTFGLLLNIIGALYVVVTSVFFCFPTFLPVTGNNMNYVCVVIGIFGIVVGIYWFFYGKTFLGPQDLVMADFEDVVGRPVSTQGSSEEDRAEKGAK